MICRVGSVSVRIQTFPPRRLYAKDQTLMLIRRSARGYFVYLSVSNDMTWRTESVSDTNFPVTQAVVRRRPDFIVNKKKRGVISLSVSNDMPKKQTSMPGYRGSGFTLMRIGTCIQIQLFTLTRIRILVQLPEIIADPLPCLSVDKKLGVISFIYPFLMTWYVG